MNPSQTAWSRPAWALLASLNAVSAIIAGAFGAIALTDPAARPGLAGPATPDLELYASLYGIRAVLLAAAVIMLLLWDRRRGGERVLALLWVAGAIQVADTILFAVVLGDAPLAIGPAVGALTHLGSAVVINRRLPRRRVSATAE